MKVYLNNYRHHWLSPYTIIDYLFFWTDWSHCHRDKSLARVVSNLEHESIWIERPAWVDRWSDRLEPFSKACEWSSKGFKMVLDFLVVITKTYGTENHATACN